MVQIFSQIQEKRKREILQYKQQENDSLLGFHQKIEKLEHELS